jgi:hypothetical protein
MCYIKEENAGVLREIQVLPAMSWRLTYQSSRVSNKRCAISRILQERGEKSMNKIYFLHLLVAIQLRYKP